MDVSNCSQAFACTVSHAEHLAELMPSADVVKGFNAISAWALEYDVYGGSKMVLLCGDNTEAKEKVRTFLHSFYCKSLSYFYNLYRFCIYL